MELAKNNFLLAKEKFEIYYGKDYFENANSIYGLAKISHIKKEYTEAQN